MDMTTDHIPSPQDISRDLRTAKWRLKQLGKQLGKAGATIYDLRCQLAALREVRGTVNPGDYRRLLNQLRDAETENRRLKEKLAAKNENV